MNILGLVFHSMLMVIAGFLVFLLFCLFIVLILFICAEIQIRFKKQKGM